jgi:MFS family permease
MLPLSIRLYLIDQDVRRASAGSTADRRTALYPLSLGYFAVFCGHQLWIASFHNYAVETFHVSALHIGYLFSVVALPGTFAFLISLIARKFSLSTLMIFACGLMGFGLIGIALSPNCYFLWPGVLSIGLGFTCFYPVANSICIQYSDKRTFSTAVGHMKSYGPLAALTACFLVSVCLPQLGYRSFFVLSGLFVVLIGLATGNESSITQYSDRQGRLRFKRICGLITHLIF